MLILSTQFQRPTSIASAQERFDPRWSTKSKYKNLNKIERPWSLFRIAYCVVFSGFLPPQYLQDGWKRSQNRVKIRPSIPKWIESPVSGEGSQMETGRRTDGEKEKETREKRLHLHQCSAWDLQREQRSGEKVESVVLLWLAADRSFQAHDCKQLWLMAEWGLRLAFWADIVLAPNPYVQCMVTLVLW